MEEQFILRVPPSVAERIERLMNESAAGSSNPDDASLDLSFSEDSNSFFYKILQADLVKQVEKHLINIMHGVSVSILFTDQNASVIGGEEGAERKKAAAPRATKPNVQEPAVNGEEAEPERSDSDESDN
ncbi:hypothetical protein PR202_ga10309 [Eleusine coracana subsp. coracana]|uniref:Transcription initiation factor TFIID subunit 7 n=1 Tax=Eleusine coracana subsp. coracana TaxID=191504 RepID=A0AAV5C6D9_ELECO|nr:hypothetical protein PR202_ga10309 [Eleusine coracana subsp. coracana]